MYVERYIYIYVCTYINTNTHIYVNLNINMCVYIDEVSVTLAIWGIGGHNNHRGSYNDQLLAVRCS